MDIYVLDIIDETIVDGVGLRTAVYCSGCIHRCDGCHNPQSWDMANGKRMSVDEILGRVLDNEFTNVTFSGGDPFLQPEGFAELARRIKAKSNKTIWCYTGWTYEVLVRNGKAKKLLQHLDVLVDGNFRKDLVTESMPFRGSSNQRLINVPESLEAGRVIELTNQ